jgi:hypothetical protein
MTLRAKIGRRILFGLGFFAAIAGVMIPLSVALDAFEIPPGLIQSDYAEMALRIRSQMISERRESDVQILMLGDSTLMTGKGMEHRHTIPAMLDRALQPYVIRRNRLKVYPFAFPGAGYTSFYFLSEELITARPDLIVVEFNLFSLSAKWADRWGRPDHSAWLGWSGIFESMSLPLHRVGLTVDRMLWTVACVELGCGSTWNFVQREQLRVPQLLDLVRAKLVSATGMHAIDDLRDRRKEAIAAERREGPMPNRRTAAAYRSAFGKSLDGASSDDVALRMLAATVRRFRAAGIPVVVYVNPVNVEAMKRRGVWNQSGIDRTLAALDATVVESGGCFIDLHDLLPDAEFRDPAEHLSYRGNRNGHALLVARLAPVVVERLRRAPGGAPD